MSQFLRLGFDGYKKIMQNLMEVAAHLAKGLLDTGTAFSSVNNCLMHVCLFSHDISQLVGLLHLLSLLCIVC